MRGGLDDALARMARMEELRRRAADPPASPGTIVEELVQAARRAVGRDSELAITVTVAYRGRTSAVRVENQDGEVTVTVAPAQPERPRAVEAPPPPQSAAPQSAASQSAPPPAASQSAPLSAASQLADLLRHSDPD
jgi:hypothetical protein